eukprot:g24328.t2
MALVWPHPLCQGPVHHHHLRCQNQGGFGVRAAAYQPGTEVKWKVKEGFKAVLVAILIFLVTCPRPQKRKGHWCHLQLLEDWNEDMWLLDVPDLMTPPRSPSRLLKRTRPLLLPKHGPEISWSSLLIEMLVALSAAHDGQELLQLLDHWDELCGDVRRRLMSTGDGGLGGPALLKALAETWQKLSQSEALQLELQDRAGAARGLACALADRLGTAAETMPGGLFRRLDAHFEQFHVDTLWQTFRNWTKESQERSDWLKMNQLKQKSLRRRAQRLSSSGLDAVLADPALRPSLRQLDVPLPGGRGAEPSMAEAFAPTEDGFQRKSRTQRKSWSSFVARGETLTEAAHGLSGQSHRATELASALRAGETQLALNLWRSWAGGDGEGVDLATELLADGDSPLHALSRLKKFDHSGAELFTLLLRASGPASLRQRNSSGQTFLHAAAGRLNGRILAARRGRSVVRLDEDDLDEEDLAILREVASKGYYHNRPKNSTNAPAPQRLTEDKAPVDPAAAATNRIHKL